VFTFCELIIKSFKETIILQQLMRLGMEIIINCWKNLFRNLCLLWMASKAKFFLIKKITYLEWKSSRDIGRIFFWIFLKTMEQNLNTTCRMLVKKMWEWIIGLMVLA
jgi:hypothetical protein